MKKHIFRLMTLCTVAVLALASCKKENQPQNNAPENGFLATVEANHGSEGRTHLDGNDVLWNADDQIVVRNGNGTSATFSLSAGENTMNGTFLSSQSGDDFFQPSYTAIYPASEGNTITGEGTATITLPATQSYVANSFANGAMPMMAVSSDQALAFKNVLGGICFPMTGDNMTVTRLVLTSNSADDNLSGVFAANYNNGQPTLTCTTGSGNSITLDCGEGVALDVETATDFTIMVPAGSLANGFKLEAYNGEEKVFEKTNDANLGESFIPRSVIRRVNNPIEVVEPTTGLTFEAKAANSTVKFTAGNATPAITMEYSTDGITWNEYTSGTAITLANVGDKVMFRGDNASSSGGIGRFVTTGQCYVYGNVMSLLSMDASATTMPDNRFSQLFYYNTAIYNHPEYPIVLPATTLATNCYAYMFLGCTNLTSAPELPATTLATGCYSNMFTGCTNLTSAPELPATTLANGCYAYMFQGCTNLTSAPELRATTLETRCYFSMFQGCTSLTSAPELPATTLAEFCYSNMFQGCTNLTTAPELPGTTLAEYCYAAMFHSCASLTSAPELPATTLTRYCYNGMFRGCTALTTAPELPATTLVQGCYDGMFYGCSNLNYIKCLATDIASIHLGTVLWVDGVSSTGTFVKAASMEDWTTGEHGIPTGWTVQNASL